jgi:hypothetical protein
MTHPVDFPQEFPRWEMEAPPLPPVLYERSEEQKPWYSAEQMREYGELCARMAREQERERLAQSVEKLVAGWDGPYRRSADLIVLAMRKG